MAFHQWLNSTSGPQPTSTYAFDAKNPPSEPSLPAPQRGTSLANGAHDVLIPYAVNCSLNDYGASYDASVQSEARTDRGVMLRKSIHTGQPKLNCQATGWMSRLEHIEQSTGPKSHIMHLSYGEDLKRKYHELMQQSTATRFDEQISKVFGPANNTSRDRPSGGRLSLPATHPANYGTPARRPNHSSIALTSSPDYVSGDTKTMPSPALSTMETFEKFLEQMQIASDSSSTSLPDPPLPDSSPLEVPWRIYSDPMHQTSFSPDFPEPYCCILRSDRHLEPGNVVSPTYMIALACGGMVEMAHHYPSKEALEEMVKSDTGLYGW